jgi:hypothetical protein
MGNPTPDISSIRALVARTRVRLRIQGALDAAALSLVLGSAAAFASVYAVRAYIITPSSGLLLLLGPPDRRRGRRASHRPRLQPV